jgi:hypothetical protein
MTAREAQVFGEWCRSENNIRKERIIRKVYEKMLKIESKTWGDGWESMMSDALEANFMSKYAK